MYHVQSVLQHQHGYHVLQCYAGVLFAWSHTKRTSEFTSFCWCVYVLVSCVLTSKLHDLFVSGLWRPCGNVFKKQNDQYCTARELSRLQTSESKLTSMEAERSDGKLGQCDTTLYCSLLRHSKLCNCSGWASRLSRMRNQARKMQSFLLGVFFNWMNTAFNYFKLFPVLTEMFKLDND